MKFRALEVPNDMPLMIYRHVVIVIHAKIMVKNELPGLRKTLLGHLLHLIYIRIL